MEEARDYEEFEPERLVKSTQRVRDLGEVFTPANIVDDMLNLLPQEIWQIHPSKTFLEPSVGSGNFVSAILSRKLTVIDEAMKNGTLPAGTSAEAAEFHALEALSSIYGVDISEDNIIGGTPGHEIACRPRLLTIMQRWHKKYLSDEMLESTSFLSSVKWIVEHNMLVGNMLETDADGNRVDRSRITLFEYGWTPSTLEVELLVTNMSDVMEVEKEAAANLATLFGPEPPRFHWSGRFENISHAPSLARVTLSGENASNSKGRV